MECAVPELVEVVGVGWTHVSVLELQKKTSCGPVRVCSSDGSDQDECFMTDMNGRELEPGLIWIWVVLHVKSLPGGHVCGSSQVLVQWSSALLGQRCLHVKSLF